MGLIIIFSILGVFCILGGAYNWQQMLAFRRIIKDTPTSQIRSAPQGYTEIKGKCAPLGNLLTSPLTNKPCVWYSCQIMEHKGDKTKTVRSEQSRKPFVIYDNTGVCVIDIQNSDFNQMFNGAWNFQRLNVSKNTWYGNHSNPDKSTSNQNGGGYQYFEYLFEPGDTVYALGDFVTLSGNVKKNVSHKSIVNLLQNWKDTEKKSSKEDEYIDEKDELGKLFKTIKQELLSKDSINILTKPKNNRQPFIISKHLEEELFKNANKQLFLAIFYLLLGISFILLCVINK